MLCGSLTVISQLGAPIEGSSTRGKNNHTDLYITTRYFLGLGLLTTPRRLLLPPRPLLEAADLRVGVLVPEAEPEGVDLPLMTQQLQQQVNWQHTTSPCFVSRPRWSRCTGRMGRGKRLG